MSEAGEPPWASCVASHFPPPLGGYYNFDDAGPPPRRGGGRGEGRYNSMSEANTLFTPVRRCTTSGADRDRRRRSERKYQKNSGGSFSAIFVRALCAPDCALIGAEAGAMRSPFPCGKANDAIHIDMTITFSERCCVFRFAHTGISSGL